MPKILLLCAALAMLTGCSNQPDPLCEVKADLAYSVAQARDRGDSVVCTLSKVKGNSQTANDQRQIIAKVYSARNVPPARIQEIFLGKCM